MITRGFLASVLVAGLAVLAASCSDSGPVPDASVDTGVEADLGPDGPGQCALTITAINGRQVSGVTELTVADDQDDVRAGIQIEVRVEGTNLPDDRQVQLSVTRLAPDPTQQAKNGRVTFEGVTIAADLNEVLIRARADGCVDSAALRLPVQPAPECFFVAPPDGAALSKKDDADPSNTTFDYDVVVGTVNAAGATVQLQIGQWGSGPVAVDSKGQVLFANTVLEVGDQVELVGRVKLGSLERTCKATISVSTDLPPCSIKFTPDPVDTSTGKKGIGVVHDANTVSDGMQATVEVSTSTLVDRVTLKVDGVPVRTEVAAGGTATFDALELPEGEVELEAVCAETKSGNVGSSPISKLVVDSVPPDDILDFACTLQNRRTGEVRCCWTAIADGGSSGSGVEVYHLRYSTTGPVTAANWSSAIQTPAVPAPVAGQPLCRTLSSLALAESYYFVLRAADLVGNHSAVAHPPLTPLAVDLNRLARAGPAATSAWGQHIAAGDFNCDGHTDLAVGEPTDGGGRGRVAIYVGTPNGFLQQPTKFLIGTVAGGNFGAHVAALPNFDADVEGCADLAVLASHGEPGPGKVYLYLGQKVLFQRSDIVAGTGAEVVFGVEPAMAGRQLSVASAGDFDHDGASDLAIVYRDDDGNVGEIWIVHGDETLTKMVEGSAQEPQERLLPTTAGVRLVGGKAIESFGNALCGAGSLDGDSFGDLLIGASETVAAGQVRGAVHVLKGAARAAVLPENLTLTGARVVTINGGVGNAAFGHAVAVIGDMDNDGVPEFAASDVTVDGDAGAVYLFNLGGTAPATAADALLTVTNTLASPAGNQLGAALGCAPLDGKLDLNNDGFADLVVGVAAYGTGGVGTVLRIDGASPLPALDVASPDYRFVAPAETNDFGMIMEVAKDIDKDGFIDLVVGDPGFDNGRGRVVVYF